jgi:hypothetical protein
MLLAVKVCIAGFLVTLILGIAAPKSLASTYYISAFGQDTNSGISPAAAWKTIARANNQTVNPGDQLLFQGGTTFSGTIFFGPPEGGTKTNPIIVSSYGPGRATIHGGTTNGFYAYNCAGLIVSNLNFVGSGRTTNRNSGIEFYNDGGGSSTMLEFLRVDRVDVSGFGFVGVVIGGWNGTNAYRDVRVTYADTHDNANAGIQTYAQYANLHSNIYVGWCRAWNNPGIPNASENTGNGIVLGHVNNAVIERCVAWTNGWLGEASAGIWCSDSTKVTIQFCESHRNRTAGTQNGGGFDLHKGTTSSVMQYNYSHDNDGAGMGVYQDVAAPPHSNNIIRFNISENDGRKNSYSSMQFWNGASGIRDVQVYNNTIFVSAPGSGTARAVYLQNTVSNVHFRNNLFITTGGVRLVEAVNNQPGVLFQGNNYWSSGGAFSIRWTGTTYASLNAWRSATGLEMVGIAQVGLSIDPQVVNAGGGGTLGDAALLETLTAYQLKQWSPLVEAGLNLSSLFGISPGSRDYYGNPVPNGLTMDIGAHDAVFPVPELSPGMEGGFFTASYLRTSPTRSDLAYGTELSGDLFTWCTNCVIPLQTNILGDGSELIKLRETTPANASERKFMRLKIRRLP